MSELKIRITRVVLYPHSVKYENSFTVENNGYYQSYRAKTDCHSLYTGDFRSIINWSESFKRIECVYD